MWQHSVAAARDMVRRSHQYTHSQGSGSGSGSGNPSDDMVHLAELTPLVAALTSSGHC